MTDSIEQLAAAANLTPLEAAIFAEFVGPHYCGVEDGEEGARRAAAAVIDLIRREGEEVLFHWPVGEGATQLGKGLATAAERQQHERLMNPQ